MDSGFWDLDSWILDSGFWILGSGLLGFWDLVYWDSGILGFWDSGQLGPRGCERLPARAGNLDLSVRFGKPKLDLESINLAIFSAP